jgi:succinate dehydrogenase flavin-adding protein (antitoxin of CptAB toxin-antitoxin module)
MRGEQWFRSVAYRRRTCSAPARGSPQRAYRALIWGVGRGWRTQGRWVEEHIDQLDAEGLRQLVLVLDQENPELYKWLTQQEPAPAHMVRSLTTRLSRRRGMRNLTHTARASEAVPDYKARMGRRRMDLHHHSEQTTW